MVLPGLHCPLRLRSRAIPVPCAWTGTVQLWDMGTCRAGVASDMCQTCLCGSSVTILPCLCSVSGPCVTYVSLHTSPTLLKWTRQWGLLWLPWAPRCCWKPCPWRLMARSEYSLSWSCACSQQQRTPVSS